MINRILISSDLLRPRIINDKIEYFHKARLDKYYYFLCYQIEKAVNIPVEKFSFNNTDFDFFKFYSLCNLELKDIHSWLDIYDLEDIPFEAIEYYKKYITDSLVIYHEAPNIIKKIHNILNIPYIDLNVHPIRFLDDNFFGFLTNKKEIFDRIKKYQIDENSFYMYANFIKAQTKSLQKSNLAQNSILFAGQTNIDKSLYSDNGIMSIFDFENEIKEFGLKYSKVYYKPHPFNDKISEIYEFLKQFNFVEIINENFYKLVSDDNISAVAAITSGTLYETKYFGKKSIFLAKPYLHFDYEKNCEFSENTTLSIYNEFLNPAFWANILQDYVDVNLNTSPIIPPHRSNELRTVFGDYWGQTELDPSVCINKKYIDGRFNNKLSSLKKEIYSRIDKNVKSLQKEISKKADKFIYKEKIGQKRIIHILGIKISYTKPVELSNINTISNKKFIFGEEAIKKLLKDYKFKTVLDIGCGEGLHSEIFKKNDKEVTSLDYGKSPYVLKMHDMQNVIIDDFMQHDFKKTKFDAIWCCHVLEHQLNPNLFLEKINSLLVDNGILAITVPPLKNEIVGGHVTVWNAGLLLYQLVLAGFDCKDAMVKKYGYNISVIVKKKRIDIKNKLIYDNGDISIIKRYLPKQIKYNTNFKDISFDGDIENINW